MFNRYDGLGITDTAIVINHQSSFLQAVAAAMRNDIVLPSVVIVGLEHSKTHANGSVIIDQDGHQLTAEDRQRIAAARADQLQAEKPDFRPELDIKGSGSTVKIDDFLPKAFRVMKPKELDVEAIKKRHE